MEYPIQYALSHPRALAAAERRAGRRTDATAGGGLRPGLQEGRSGRLPARRPWPGKRSPGAEARRRPLNAANETAVAAFLGGEAPFTAIVPAVAEVLERHGREAGAAEPATIDEALEWDSWGRRRAREVLARVRG